MSNVLARIKLKGKQYEIFVDIDKALQFKKTGQGSVDNILAVNEVFYDVKKGTKASSGDLENAFGSQDINVIAEKIIRQGEILLPLEYRKKTQENKLKQVIDFLSKNALDPKTNKPHTPMRIQSVLEQSGINIDNRPVEEQLPKIIFEIKKILPLKIESKRLLLKIPAIYTGSIYGLINQYKEKEDWQNDGSLNCTINLPAGFQMDFYDKLNAITHGSVIVEEIKDGS